MLLFTGNSRKGIFAFCGGKDPISTPPTPISSQIRRHLATSRIGTIIARRFKNRYAELYVVIPAAVFVLAFCGYSAQGHATFLSGRASEYFEDVALAADVPAATSGMQLAYINSFSTNTAGGDVTVTDSTASLAFPTDHESAIMAMTPPDGEYLDSLEGESNQVTKITVSEGAALSLIASDFGVCLESIMLANGLKDADSLSLGQELIIPPPPCTAIHKVAKGDTVLSLAKKYGVEPDDITVANHLPKEGVLEIGGDISIENAKISGAVAVALPAITGTASTARIVASTKQFGHLPDLGSYFKIPTTGTDWGRIHGHNGVDIANSCGTPIYAAADGQATVAISNGAYNGGFGNHIVISHSNGTETLYAHLMKLLIVPRAFVAKGQQIALMGGKPGMAGAGRSTGCHLHFEVHGARNPLAK